MLVQRCGRESAVACKAVCPFWKTVEMCLKILKVGLGYDPATSDYISRGIKISPYIKEMSAFPCLCSIMHNSQDMGAIQVSMNALMHFYHTLYMPD